MISLDGYLYWVEAGKHTEVQIVPRKIMKTVGGKVLSVTGLGTPRIWRYTLIVPDYDFPSKRDGEGDLETLRASHAKTDPTEVRLVFYDERTIIGDGVPTCFAIMCKAELPADPIGQVLTDTKYHIEVELMEALS